MKFLSFRILFVMVTIVLFASCKKDSNNNTPPYECATCNKTPEAVAANDASTKGIYKGVVIGSSGTIKFNIANNSNAINAVMVIDGTTVNLTSTITWTNGQPYVAPFTGTLNGQAVSITFSVGINGTAPTITSASIPSHPNAVFNLVKETSNALLECFEGTYKTSKPESGTFNILLSRSLRHWGGVARKDGTNTTDDVKGSVDNAGKMTDTDGNLVGTLSGDQISGSFKDKNNTSVTIAGKRTL